MCRIFAFLSVDPILLEDVLVTPPHAITKQVHTRYIQQERAILPPPKRVLGTNRNLAGFGITWFTDTLSKFDKLIHGPHPAIYKTTIAQPDNDTTFVHVCRHTASEAILAHVRATHSPPIVSTNNHPFVFGRHCFMHNGAIERFREIRAHMFQLTSQKYINMIEGSTDTEHFAALYFSRLDELRTIEDIEKSYPARKMWKALEIAIEQVLDIQVKRFGKRLDNYLNICTTDGESLVALRYNNNLDATPATLYASFTVANKLNRKHLGKGLYEDSRDESAIDDAVKEIIDRSPPITEFFKPEDQAPYVIGPYPSNNLHGPHIVVASETITFDPEDWLALGKGQVLMVDKENDRITVDFDQVKI